MKHLEAALNEGDCLSRFFEAGVLDHLDVLLARTLIQLSGRQLGEFGDSWTDVELVALAAAMASRAPSYGHVAFAVHDAKKTVVDNPNRAILLAEPLPWPHDTNRWIEALKADNHLVFVLGQNGEAFDQIGKAFDSDSEWGQLPLILDEATGYLYLNRYFRYEDLLANDLSKRLSQDDPTSWYNGDESLLTAFKMDLELLIPMPTGAPDAAMAGVMAQRLAALISCANQFSVITGAPGTGKTSVVTVLVLLLARLHEACQAGRPFKVELMAPTGKAAARMTEAIRTEINNETRGLKARLKGHNAANQWEKHIDRLLRLDAKTIHRGLGMRPDNVTNPRFHAGNPIPADLVIVDEASMVDIGMMTRLVQAVSPQSKLVLLGDRDQLASVEAGAVLADLCLHGDREPVQPWLGELAKKVLNVGLPIQNNAPNIASAVSNLSYSFRTDVPEIVRLSKAIRENDLDTAMLEINPASNAVRFMELDEQTNWEPDFLSFVFEAWAEQGDTVLGIIKKLNELEKFGDYSGRDQAALAALKALEHVRILCTHRVGPRGVERVNRLFCQWILPKAQAAGCISQGAPLHEGVPLVEGTPIIVLANDHQVQLFNGDVGVILRDPAVRDPAVRDPVHHDGPRLVAVFPDANTGYRAISLSRLPEYEPVYAMTIHKSQGSQFDHAVVLLPPKDSDFVTKDLIYTGITRAKKKVTIVGQRPIFEKSIRRQLSRASGLRKRFWG